MIVGRSLEDREASRGMNVGGRRFLPWGSLLLLIIAWGVLTLASIPYRPSLERLNEVQVDEPAPLTVYAPFSFKAANETETAKRRLEAEKSVPPTFKRIPDVVETADRKWKALVQISKTNNPKIWDELADVDVTDASRAARDFWNENLTPRERSLLGLKVADTDWCSAIQSILIKTLQDQELLLDQREVEVLHPTDGQQWVSWKLKDLDGIIKERISGSTVFAVTEEVRRLSKRLAESDFGKIEEAEDLVESLANFFVVPTIEQDYIATTRDKQLASASVSSVSIEVKQGSALIRQGNQVTEEQMRTLVALRQQRESRLGEVAGRAILVFAILWILCGYLQRYNRDLLEDIPRLAALLGQIAFVVWTGFLVSWGVEALEGVNSPVGYLVPVAAVGILVTLLESSRLGIFSVLLTTVLVGLQTYWDFTILVVLALTGIIAVYHATGASIRSQIYLAWPWIVVPGIVMSTGVHLVANPSWQAFTSTLTPFFWGWFWLALNGFLSVGISLLLLPLLEDVLGVTTEFKLRELSVSHPLLRRLEEVAPGTYYHSLNVSVLAEAAAAAIGANALLVKVAAYYHDIGKVEKPAYFGENQFTEEDKKKHSKISPHMSCLIIRNHVKIGLEMAREYKLPEAILPFIAEHHGTTLISYFYDTARAEDPHGTVTEGDFRYTGPKPQTIEEAVMMLADTIEAASRSMKLVGEGEIRVFVKRMINDKMIDGQFDECPLTFKELRILSESFTRTLRSMMHRRIAYPSTPEVELHPKSGQEQNVQPLFGGS